MTTKATFLKAPELKEYLDGLEVTVRHARRLPLNVFSKNMPAYYFFEFDVMLEPAFWNVLRTIGSELKTDEIVTTVLDPNPIDYYEREFGYCSAFTLPLNAREEDYYAALTAVPNDSPADALLYISTTVVWAPKKGAWAAWGEREKGIGVVGLCRPCNLAPVIKDLAISKSLAAQLLDDAPGLARGEAGTTSKQFFVEYKD